MTETIQTLKEDIAILQEKLQKLEEQQQPKSPVEELKTLDWKWSEDAEIGFVEWYNDEYGTYSCRSEWFQGDCEVEDEKTRKDLMYRWIHAAFSYAYQKGFEAGKYWEDEE